MNINLHNYETFFLMYVDHELSATEKEMVEAFIDAHPYLQEELDVLQDTVLQMGEEVVIDKSSLFKSAALEESMLLHLDNELVGEEQNSSLQNIQSNVSLQKDWNLLQQTKLDPSDTYVFENKEILYRKEKARLIRFAYVKWVAAAALIAAGFFVAIHLLNQQQKTEVAVKPSGSKTERNNPSNEKAPSELVKAISPANDDHKGEFSKQNLDVQQAADDEINLQQLAKKQTAIPSKKNNKASFSTEDQVQQQWGNVSTVNNKKELPNDEDIVRNTITKNEKLVATPSVQELPTKLLQQPVTTANINTASIKNSNEGNSIVMAALNNDTEENNERIFLLDEDDVNRSKAGAFFKRIKRTVARTMGVKPGNSLKIAGFEFTVK